MGLWGRKANEGRAVRDARVWQFQQRQQAESNGWTEHEPPRDPNLLIRLLSSERERLHAAVMDRAVDTFIRRAGAAGAAERFINGSWHFEQEARHGAAMVPPQPPADYERRWALVANDRNVLARAVAEYGDQLTALAVDRQRVEREKHEQLVGDRRAARMNSRRGGIVLAGDWQSAELLAASALRSFGYRDARVTKGGADGGLDVVGRSVAAQVKYLAKPVGRPVLQQTVGAGGGRQLAIFSRAGYSKAAIEYADANRIALFTIELPSRIGAVNRVARGMAR